jgi:hypothetical protein
LEHKRTVTNFLHYNPRRRNFILGLTLLGAGILLNPTLLTALFSADGQLSQRSVVIIWLCAAVLITLGIVLALSRSFVTLFNVCVGLLFTALLLYGAEKIVFYQLNQPSTAAPDSAAAAQRS